MLLEKLQEPQQGEEATYASTSSSRRVNADGTYATESSLGSLAPLEVLKNTTRPPIRSLLLRGDFFLGAALATTLAKLTLRFQELSEESSRCNSMRAEAMLVMTGVIRLGQSQFCSAPIDDDNYDRIIGNIKVLGEKDSPVKTAYSEDTRAAYSQMLARRPDTKAAQDQVQKKVKVEVDDLVPFRLLASKGGRGGEDEYARDLTLATGELAAVEETAMVTKLDRIVGLSGFSDSVYCEAVVEVHQRDIHLELLMVNQTGETLQNVTLEFATVGDLRLVEKPAPCTLAPHAFHSTRASVKVSSTETGVIFGNLTYDRPGASGSGAVVVLNDLHVDIMDYIHPATCSLRAFRIMWTEFEWENKVNVNTKIT